MQHANHLVVGVDVAKETFCVYAQPVSQKAIFETFKNQEEGFRCLLKHLPENCTVVMEASGPYFLPLAQYLFDHQIQVSVVNPLAIKRFMQAQLKRTKTDRVDAQGIAEYGTRMDLVYWKPKAENIQKIRELNTLLERYQRQLTACTNQLTSLQSAGIKEDLCEKLLIQEIDYYQQLIKQVTGQMESLVDAQTQDLRKRIETIPGIGKKSSLLLLVACNCFENFDNYKQVISYLGLSPRVYESGKSIKARASICKMGMGHVRRTLYMASRAARKHNAACKQLYDRLIANGKPHKVAVIAVVNKLIKQVFAILKNGTIYDPSFGQKAVIAK
ncbi:MAG: IS110 family transposase [Cyclobacteriaceae bacterium]|jgi:transposase